MATVCSVCWFLGVVVFGVVERMHTDISHETDVSPPSHAHSALLAAAGGLTYVTGVTGYWGSMHLEHGMVCGFSYIVLISGLIEVSIGALALAYSGKAIEQETMRFINRSVEEDEDYFFDLQEQLQCCGSESPSDWAGSVWWRLERIESRRSSRVVPRSCCRKPGCEEGPPPYTRLARPELVHQQGCQDAVVRRRHDLLLSSGVVSCACGAVKLASYLVVHCCLAKSILAKQRRMEELRRRPSLDLAEVKREAESHYRRRISRLREA